MTGHERCADCNGEGYWMDRYGLVRCVVCGGTGRVFAHAPAPGGEETHVAHGTADGLVACGANQDGLRLVQRPTCSGCRAVLASAWCVPAPLPAKVSEYTESDEMAAREWARRNLGTPPAWDSVVPALARFHAAAREQGLEAAAKVLDAKVDEHDTEYAWNAVGAEWTPGPVKDRTMHRGFCECFGVTTLTDIASAIRSLKAPPK